jgi:hypothetical protein
VVGTKPPWVSTGLLGSMVKVFYLYLKEWGYASHVADLGEFVRQAV